jgi:hypothetical protein
VVRGRIELPTPRFSGTRNGANRAKYGEPREIAVAESIVGWTDLDGGPVRTGAPRAASRVWESAVGDCRLATYMMLTVGGGQLQYAGSRRAAAGCSRPPPRDAYRDSLVAFLEDRIASPAPTPSLASMSTSVRSCAGSSRTQKQELHRPALLHNRDLDHQRGCPGRRGTWVGDLRVMSHRSVSLRHDGRGCGRRADLGFLPPGRRAAAGAAGSP